VDIVTGPAGERVKINTLVFKPGVFRSLLAVTPEANLVLLSFVFDRIKFNVKLVAPGTVDIPAIVHTVPPDNRIALEPIAGMTVQAGVDLLLSVRKLAAATEMDHFGKTLAAMGAGHVKTTGTVTGFAAGHIFMRTVHDGMHFVAGMTTQTNLVTAIGVVWASYGSNRQKHRLSQCRRAQHDCNKR